MFMIGSLAAMQRPLQGNAAAGTKAVKEINVSDLAEISIIQNP
jgi:hypothetical protein